MDAFWWFVIGGCLGLIVGSPLGYYTSASDELSQRRLNRKLNNL